MSEPRPSHPRIYDSIGGGYGDRRVPDPRIAARIRAALGDAETVCNVGAGAGSYEPDDLDVTAVEPSARMVAQRRNSFPVVRASAERLPFADASFDAALAVLTVHHWLDARRGLQEMRRIAPRQVVLAFDMDAVDSMWLVRDYLPEVTQFDKSRTPSIDALAEILDAQTVEPVLVPWDCTDGFLGAYWRRPEQYLIPAARAAISSFQQLPESVVQRAIDALGRDLESGEWQSRHAGLLSLDELDVGYRLVVAG